MRRRSFRFIAGISALVATAALALPVKSARRPKYGGTLRVEISAQVTSLVPGITQSTPEAASAKILIEGLLHEIAPFQSIGVSSSSKIDPRDVQWSTSPGAFTVGEWDPGKHASLAANADSRLGRPFVDTIDIQMGRSAHDSLLDLEAGKADFAEIQPQNERTAREAGVRTSISEPDELLALVFLKGRAIAENSSAREAVSLAIDRAAMVNFTLQKNGEPAGGLLPQWLSGTAFLFPVPVDVGAAKEHWREKPNAGPATLGYDSGDTLEQALAERIAVNGREAGIEIRIERLATGAPAPANCDARLVRLRIPSKNPAIALANFENTLAPVAGLDDMPLPNAATPQEIYDRERAIVSSYRVIPLLWLPRVYGLSARVHDWTAPAPGEPWPFANVWLGDSP
jgi:ABC-type oligopeptide transport system substrate-binding subunit